MFDVTCDNKSSFQIVAVGGTMMKPVYGKPVLLVKCDRLDPEDNARGLRLANVIKDVLNALNQNDAESLLADEMIPINFGE